MSTSQEQAVKDRYTEGASERVEALCCPTQYNTQFLKVIPQVVIDRDYGCGDPSQHLRPGETVLDLGSGGGKICFIASQVVGKEGRVIGVDMNEHMLALATENAPVVAERIGYANVEFRRGRIQHLEPIVASESIDVVVSNCVLNLVRNEEKQQLFREIFRVLRPSGRAVISDIVSGAPVPPDMQNDPELWSGCISGALQEHSFSQAFLDAGFDTTETLERQTDPWRVVRDIEFRSMTVAAYKTKASTNPQKTCCP